MHWVDASRTVARRLREEEDGSFLVEILVSAVIVVMVAIGVLALFDTASRQSGEQRAKAVASTLAASELERIRSLPYAQVVGLDVTLPVREVGGTDFTISSRAERALTGAARGDGCSSSSRGAEALQVTTTVSWASRRDRPVRLSSMIAGPASASSSAGSVVAQILTADGAGVSGLVVSLSGAATATTDVNGCVRFRDVAARQNYRLTFSRPGWTTPDGQPGVDDRVDVVAGQTQTRSYQYDPLAGATATFVFSRDGRATGTRVPAPQPGVSWRHTSLPGGVLTQPLDPAAAEASAVLAASQTQYGVHAGTCEDNEPPVVHRSSVTAPNGTVEVRVPTVQVGVRFRQGGADVPVPGVRVFVTNTCDGGRVRFPDTAADGTSVGGAPYATPADGGLTICVEGELNGVTHHHRVSGLPNTSYTARNVHTLTITAPERGGCA